VASPQSLKRIISTYFDVVPSRSTNEELTFVCVELGCKDVSGNRSLNLKTGKTNCWRCGKGGDFFRWARRLGYEIEDDGTNETNLNELDNLFQTKRRDVGHVVSVPLPEGFTKLSDEKDSVYFRLCSKMAAKKNLSIEDFTRAGAGFTRVGIWEPFCIFPVVEWGRAVYYQGRTYSDLFYENGKKLPTKKFPSRSVVPKGSRYWVYNIDELRNGADCCIIVESILNVLSLKRELARRSIKGVIPVAIFKHAVSPEQYMKLTSIPSIGEFCMMFDEDAIADAYSHVERKLFVPNMDKFSVVEMPEKVDANDDAELAVDLFLAKRKKYGGSSGGVLGAISNSLDRLEKKTVIYTNETEHAKKPHRGYPSTNRNRGRY
jgi:hypothetical protein